MSHEREHHHHQLPKPRKVDYVITLILTVIAFAIIIWAVGRVGHKLQSPVESRSPYHLEKIYPNGNPTNGHRIGRRHGSGG